LSQYFLTLRFVLISNLLPDLCEGHGSGHVSQAVGKRLKKHSFLKWIFNLHNFVNVRIILCTRLKFLPGLVRRSRLRSCKPSSRKETKEQTLNCNENEKLLSWKSHFSIPLSLRNFKNWFSLFSIFQRNGFFDFSMIWWETFVGMNF
jgi:hypothetical protein